MDYNEHNQTEYQLKFYVFISILVLLLVHFYIFFILLCEFLCLCITAEFYFFTVKVNVK